MTELNKLQIEYPFLSVCFRLLDALVYKMKLVALKKKSASTITFVDYIDEHEYYIPFEQANEILDYYYCNVFFKPQFQDSNFYLKVKELCSDAPRDQFDFFFRALFFVIKKNYKVHRITKEETYTFITKSYFNSFDAVPINLDYIEFLSTTKILLYRLEQSRLLWFNTYDLAHDYEILRYFPLSSNTFKFSPLRERSKNYKLLISPMFDFLDLRFYLKNLEYLKNDYFSVIDTSMQAMLQMSFKDGKYHKNQLSDNSYFNNA